jgi:hypothetical protein
MNLENSLSIRRKEAEKKLLSTDSFELYFLKEELSREIYRYHEKGDHFTVNDLHFYAKNELEFSKGRTTLYNTIKTMDYKYKKGNNRLVLSEKPHIKALKLKLKKNIYNILKILKI